MQRTVFLVFKNCLPPNSVHLQLTIVATALFPRHVTASGHIEPGSAGHMRLGREMGYPSTLPPTVLVAGLDKVSIDTISFNIVYVACQVGNYLQKFIYFFYMLKETFKFWASGCHFKGPLPPPLAHKILL